MWVLCVTLQRAGLAQHKKTEPFCLCCIQSSGAVWRLRWPSCPPPPHPPHPCEGRGGHPGPHPHPSIPNSPYRLCGRKATLSLNCAAHTTADTENEAACSPGTGLKRPQVGPAVMYEGVFCVTPHWISTHASRILNLKIKSTWHFKPKPLILSFSFISLPCWQKASLLGQNMFWEGWFFKEQHSSSTGRKEHIFWILYILSTFRKVHIFWIIHFIWITFRKEYIFCIIHFM